MGAVLRIHYFDQSTDEVHFGCEHHPNAYWTWCVSEDGRWLICKRFERGIERTQTPMVNIKALVVLQCLPPEPDEPGEPSMCACGLFGLPSGQHFREEDGVTHRSKLLGDVLCGEPGARPGG